VALFIVRGRFASYISGMTGSFGSEYLQWVKTRTPAQFNLATSAVSPYPLAELGIRIEDLEINGPTLYGYEPLQNAVATHCGVSADCAVAASGTSMANFIVMCALIQRGDEVLIEKPTYEPILAVARYCGADINRLPRGKALEDFVSHRTRLIVLTNLHNPTSMQLGSSDLMRIADIAKSAGARVLVDEVYLESLYEKARSAFHENRAFICTGSLTKAYGLGGLRCGWILAEPDLARRFWQFKDLIDSSAPHPPELLSVIALRQLGRIAARAKSLLAENRAKLKDFLHSHPQVELKVPEFGTCVFPRVRSLDGDRLFEMLHSRFDTDVVPGRFFEMPDHFRMGIGMDTATFAEGLRRLDLALR
jgi:aspartate/methionine/tyrosine aminotransferase